MIKDFLNEFNKDLKSIIASMDSNSDVYRAFLRDVEPELVKDLFRKVIAGSKALERGSLRRPVINCVTNERSFDWDWCRRTQLGGGWGHHTARIILCPKWITNVKNSRPHRMQCGKTFRAGHDLVCPMAGTQYGSLLHELIHIYIGVEHLKPEVYDMKKSMTLSGSEAFRNPVNLVQYVVCRLLHIYSFSDKSPNLTEASSRY